MMASMSSKYENQVARWRRLLLAWAMQYKWNNPYRRSGAAYIVHHPFSACCSTLLKYEPMFLHTQGSKASSYNIAISRLVIRGGDSVGIVQETAGATDIVTSPPG
jgi:hypothetical protein